MFLGQKLVVLVISSSLQFTPSQLFLERKCRSTRVK